jgi:hypothetical protein
MLLHLHKMSFCQMQYFYLPTYLGSKQYLILIGPIYIHMYEGVNGVPLSSAIVTNIGQLSVSIKIMVKS